MIILDLLYVSKEERIISSLQGWTAYFSMCSTWKNKYGCTLKYQKIIVEVLGPPVFSLPSRIKHWILRVFLRLSTYLVRTNRIGFWRFPRQNDAVWSDLPDDVQTDRVFRSDQARVFTIVALKIELFLFQICREVITSSYEVNITIKTSFCIYIEGLIIFQRSQSLKTQPQSYVTRNYG